jgi:hypothetical protein
VVQEEGGYSLGNRKQYLNQPQNTLVTNKEEVVVEVSVDRTGRTTSATGIKGTTNTASCLLEQAKLQR